MLIPDVDEDVLLFAVLRLLLELELAEAVLIVLLTTLNMVEVIPPLVDVSSARSSSVSSSSSSITSSSFSATSIISSTSSSISYTK